jgi:hypothetical protein
MSPKIGAVTLPADLNKDSIEKILQDFYKNPKLSVTQVTNPPKPLQTCNYYTLQNKLLLIISLKNNIAYFQLIVNYKL